MAHSSTLTWRIPWTEEPGGLESVGRQKVGHDWSDSTHILVLKGYIKSKWQWGITSYWSEWPSLKWLQINATEGVEKREPSYTVGGSVSWCSYYGKQYGVPQKSKNRITIWFSSPTLRYLPRQNYNWKDTCTPMLTAALLTTTKTWKQSKCPSTNEWIKKTWCIIQRNSTI